MTNYNFAFGSFLFMVVATFFFFSRRRIPSSLNRAYSYMLCASTIAVFLDFFVAYAELHSISIARPIMYALNIAYFVMSLFCIPAFCYYLLEYMGRFSTMSRAMLAVYFLPMAITLLDLFSSPFWKRGVFYINEAGLYATGETHLIVYACPVFYVIFAVIAMVKNRKKISRSVRMLITFYLVLLAAAMLFQIFNSDYLITTATMALCIVGMYFILLSPSNYIDSLTGCYNRLAFPVFIEDMYADKLPFSLTVVSLSSFDMISKLYGMETAEKSLVFLSQQLKRAFPRSITFRPYYKDFVLMDIKGHYTFERINKKIAAIKRLYKSGSIEFLLELNSNHLKSEDYDGLSEIVDIIDYLTSENAYNKDENLTIITKEAKKAFLSRSVLMAALPELINTRSVEIYYRVIMQMDKTPAFIEVYPYVDAEIYGKHSPDVIYALSEQTGNQKRLCFYIFSQVFEFLKNNDLNSMGLGHIEIKIPIKLYAVEDVCDYLVGQAKKLKIDPGKVCLTLSNLETLESVDEVICNVTKLSEFGFILALDDFGAGFTETNFISKVPYSYVKIHHRLLKNALLSAKSAGYISIIYDALKQLNCRLIQKGINSKREYDFVKVFDITFGEGDYFSEKRPLSELREKNKQL